MKHTHTHVLRTIFIVALALLFAVVMTWPLTKYITTYYSDASDHTYGGWTMWHLAQAVKNRTIFNTQILFTSNQLYPFSNSFAYSDHMFFPGLVLFTPFYLITNEIIFSTNIVILLAFTLTFIASFYTIQYFVKNTYVAIIGALIFTYNPLVFAQFPHHSDLLQRYFLPLVFLWGYRYIHSPSWRSACIFFGVFTLNWFTAVYYGIFALIFIPLFCVPIFLEQLKNGVPYVKKLLITSLSILIFVPAIMFITKPYLTFSQNEKATRSIEQTVFFSARGLDWFSPDPRNLLYVKDRQHVNDQRFPKELWGFNYSEHTLFLNIIPSLLFIFGMLYLLKVQRGRPNTGFIIGLGLLLITSAVLTFGPISTGWNEPGISPGSRHPFLYYYAYKTFFIFRALRVPTRFQHLFYFPFSLICAYGVVFIKNRLSKHTHFVVATVLLILLIVLENLLIVNFSEQSYRLKQIQTYMKNSPALFQKLENKPTIHIPMYQYADQFKELGYINWATYTHELTVNGYSGYVPADYWNIVKQSKELDKSFVHFMANINVHYIIVHLDNLSDTQKEEIKSNSYSKPFVVFKDSKTIIYDITKDTTALPSCSTARTKITIRMPKLTSRLTTLPFTFSLKNVDTCVLQSIYDTRYLKLKLQLDDYSLSTKITVPLILNPGKTFYTSGTFRSGTSYVALSLGMHKGTITISRFNKKIDFAILSAE